MKKYLVLTFVLCVLTFFSVEVYAYDSECSNKLCNPCPMCECFNDNSLLKKSKEELLKMKEIIEHHLTKENMEKLGNKAVEAMQDTLSKIDKKLDKLKK